MDSRFLGPPTKEEVQEKLESHINRWYHGLIDQHTKDELLSQLEQIHNPTTATIKSIADQVAFQKWLQLPVLQKLMKPLCPAYFCFVLLLPFIMPFVALGFAAIMFWGLFVVLRSLFRLIFS